MGPAQLRLYVLLLIAAFSIAAIVFAAVRRGLLMRSAKDWQTVEGKVQSAKLFKVRQRGEYVSSYQARIFYSYTFEGEYYGGDFTFESITQDKAQAFLLTHRPDTRIFLKVDPRHPDRSLLLKA